MDFLAYEDAATNSVVFDTVQTFPSYLGCDTTFKMLTVNASLRDWEEQVVGLKLTRPYRIVLPLDQPGATVVPKAIGDVHGMEFPTIHYDKLNGLEYQFAYGCFIDNPLTGYYDSIIKLNVQTGA